MKRPSATALAGKRVLVSGGAGLGLSIAQTLARQMKGDIVLTPTPGAGLTATVLLER